MTRPRALIVDDEPDLLELVALTLARMDIDSDRADSLAAARARLGSADYAFCLTDLRLGDGSGLELVESIQQRQPELPVAVITAYGDMDTAVGALKAGAFDFVPKPLQIDKLRGLVRTALQLRQGDDQGPRIERRSRDELIGDAPAMRRIRGLITRYARSEAPTFIGGESGTGKELVARLIHARGPRARGPFVAINCGAIPRELMESEFFGHIKGTFTGAHRDKLGLFRAAEGGTLFLDEITELPLDMQVKLLRAIQERAVRPVGHPGEIAVNVRLLSASHRPLARQVETGQFRQDLYYRLHVLSLELPPLRERREDIPELARRLLQRLTRGQPSPPTLDPDTLQRLQDYPFPGNVRELENHLERALALCEDGHIRPADLMLAPGPVNPPAGPAPSGGPPARPAAPDTSALPPEGLEAHLADIERRLLRQAMTETGGNKTLAAERLGLSFRAFRYRWNKLGLDQPPH